MKFSRIKFVNFRQYNNVTIDFTDGINFLEGNNGAGKSTLMGAFIFALYGFDALKKSNLIKNLSEESLVNSESIEHVGTRSIIRQATAKVEVTVDFEDESQYIITREYNCKEKFSELKVKKSIGGILKNVENLGELKKRIPENIISLLFFDGERIKTIEDAMTSGINNDFKDEIEKILKISEMNNVKNLLNRTKKKLSYDFDNEELNDIVENINKYELRKEKTKEELIKCEMVIENNKKEEMEIKNFLKQHEESKKNQELIEFEQKRIKNNEENKEKIYSDLEKKLFLDRKKTLNMIIFEGILKKVKNSDEDVYEISGIEQRAIDFILEKESCICGKCITDIERKNLINVKKTLPPESFQSILNAALKFKNNVEDLEKNKKTKYQELMKIKKESKEINDNINKLKEFKGMDIGEDLLKQSQRLTEIEDEILDQIRQQGVLDEDNRRINKLLTKLEQDYDRELKKQKKNQIKVHAVNLLENAKKQLEMDIEERKSTIKENLQVRFNFHIKDILRDDVKVIIDDKLKPGIPEFKNGANSESTGQSILISIAYLLSLIDVAKIDYNYSEFQQETYPIILDGVTATLDLDHTNRLMEKLKKYEGQIIILANTKEIKPIISNFSDQEKIIELIREENSSEIQIGEKYGI